MKEEYAMKRLLTAVVAISLLTLGAASVRADVTPFLNSITGSANNWTWTYHAELSSAQELSSIGAIPGTSGSTMGDRSTQYKDFMTIYDFNGFIPGSATSSADWLFQSLNVGTTSVNIIPYDNPNIPNLTWVYIGTGITGPKDSLNGLGLFSAKSIYGTKQMGFFASDATKHDAVNTMIDGLVQINGGSVTVPTVPEPSTFVLLGTGLLGAFSLKRRAKKVEPGVLA
jgi:hypothetical protein